jgi:hypothetical protein
MNAQLLEYARIELRLALADLSGGTKGQLQAFAENPPADKNLHPRKPIHQIALEGGKTVDAYNTALYVLETRSRRRPMPPMNEYEFATCGWRRAVNTLPTHQNSWVRYCYGFDTDFQHQKNICEAIWNAYQIYLPTGLMKKTQKRLVSLVWLAVQDVATKNKNESYTEYAGAALAELMCINRSTWKRVYSAHWVQLKQAVQALDLVALQNVLHNQKA